MNDPILIVGAGLSGLAAAQTLHTLGASVLVVEKSRGPGGRMSTRHETLHGKPVSFDHGAQFFRGHDAGFRQVMDAWERDRWIAPWRGNFVRIKGEILEPDEGRLRYAPGPGMNRICQEYADRLKDQLRYQTRITELREDKGRIVAAAEDGTIVGAFRAAICTAPGPQTAKLLEGFRPTLAMAAASTSYAPCLAAMVAFAERPTVEWCAASIQDGPLSFVAEDNARPGHQPALAPSRWILHASASWSAEHIEENPEVFAPLMLAAFGQLPGVQDLDPPVHLRGHRWRFALVEKTTTSAAQVEGTPPVAIAGDWCEGPRIEAAWSSGVRAASAIRKALT